MYTVIANGVPYMGSYYDSREGFALQFPSANIARIIMNAVIVTVFDPNGVQIQNLTRRYASGNVVYF